MRFHDHELVRGARDICDRHGIVLIADEIATGFGRTGDLFATQAAGVVPDIMCVGKAMTGGFMTMAATLATAKVAAGMHPRALMHGPTFMANPLACAVSAEATALILEGQWREQVAGIEKQLQRGFDGLAQEPGVADVRVLGAIGVVEMEREVNMAAATAAAVGQGVWLRPFGRLIYIMPPFISTAEEVAQMCRGVRAAVAGGQQ